MQHVTLAAEGRCFTRIIADDDSETTGFAADELRRFIGLIADVDALAPQDDALVTIRLKRGAGPARRGDDSFVIDVQPSGDVLIEGATTFALLHAAYRFLELAGCRWFAPDYAFYGETGADIPRTDSLRAPVGRHAETPAFRNRKKYVEEARSHTAESLRQLVAWMPKAGHNVLNFPTNCFGEGNAVWDEHRDHLIPELARRGITLEVGGHGFENFITNDDLVVHPDWAGMRPDGTREPDHGKRTFCTSNREALDFFTPAVMRYIADRPEIDIFSLWPPDTTDWCCCDSCRRLGAIETRNALVINEVARAAANLRDDLIISFAAYYEPTRPPDGVVFEDNVEIDFCPITRSHGHRIYDPANAINRQYHDLLLSWFDTPAYDGELNIYTYYRKYAWRSLPILLPTLITDELRHYRHLGAVGIGSYSEAGDWWTFELQHYVIARMSWDPATSLDDLLTEYFERRYGEAAPHVADLVRLLEQFLAKVARIQGTTIDPTSQPASIYEFFRPSQKIMDGFEAMVGLCRAAQARAAATDGLTQEIRERLAKWSVLIDYVALEVEARGHAQALAERAIGGYLAEYVDCMRRTAELVRAHRDSGLVVYPRWAEYDEEIRQAVAASGG